MKRLCLSSLRSHEIKLSIENYLHKKVSEGIQRKVRKNWGVSAEIVYELLTTCASWMSSMENCHLQSTCCSSFFLAEHPLCATESYKGWTKSVLVRVVQRNRTNIRVDTQRFILRNWIM